MATLLTNPPSCSALPQKDSAGYRLLSAMGWREGEGLGAAKQGIKAHIRVKKKFENWGVGAVSAD
jgi:Pin2-interacting protein X1